MLSNMADELRILSEQSVEMFVVLRGQPDVDADGKETTNLQVVTKFRADGVLLPYLGAVITKLSKVQNGGAATAGCIGATSG